MSKALAAVLETLKEWEFLINEAQRKSLANEIIEALKPWLEPTQEQQPMHFKERLDGANLRITGLESRCERLDNAYQTLNERITALERVSVPVPEPKREQAQEQKRYRVETLDLRRGNWSAPSAHLFDTLVQAQAVAEIELCGMYVNAVRVIPEAGDAPVFLKRKI